MDIKEKLNQLPHRPGVYRMIDSHGNIIYVGKAKNLKNRVSQYFRNKKDRDPKTAEMLNHIQTFNFIVLDTELDAFIEECRLIKEIQPMYNRLMKSSRNYSYIKIPSEPYPKVLKVKEKADDGALYFGPYTSRHRVETAIQYMNDFYPIRKCTSPGLLKRANGCLFLQLGNCLGVCTGQISIEEYNLHLEKIRKFLNGDDQSIVHELSGLMDSAVKNLNFEQAAKYREYYLGLRHILAKQQLLKSSEKNRNILSLEFMDDEHLKLFFIKGNKLLDRAVINLITEDGSDLRKHLKELIIDRFIAVKGNPCGLTQHDLDEAQIIYSYLRKNKSRILSFWIPSGYLQKETWKLDDLIKKIIDRINLHLGFVKH